MATNWPIDCRRIDCKQLKLIKGDVVMLNTRTRSQYRSYGGRVIPFDAISQLKAYHRRIGRLFERSATYHSNEEITALIQSLCDQLAIYLAIKEEIVYPSLYHATDKVPPMEVLNESVVEHFSLKFIMGMLDGQAASDQLFIAKVNVLERHFFLHVESEERWLFPELLLPGFRNLSRQIQERRNELESQRVG